MLQSKIKVCWWGYGLWVMVCIFLPTKLVDWLSYRISQVMGFSQVWVKTGSTVFIMQYWWHWWRGNGSWIRAQPRYIWMIRLHRWVRCLKHIFIWKGLYVWLVFGWDEVEATKKRCKSGLHSRLCWSWGHVRLGCIMGCMGCGVVRWVGWSAHFFLEAQHCEVAVVGITMAALSS